MSRGTSGTFGRVPPLESVQLDKCLQKSNVQGQKSRFLGNGHPTFNRKPLHLGINPIVGLMTIPYCMETVGV